MEEGLEEGKLERRELLIVKEALARILQEENPLPPHQHRLRDDELSRRLGLGASPSQELEPRDLSVISRLLHQVWSLERDNDKESLNEPTNLKMEASCNDPVANDKTVADTMVQLANAAAEAAKAAAASSGKILEMSETVLLNSGTSISRQLVPSDGKSKGQKAQEESSRPMPSSDEDLVKKFHRQNQITHCILGLMIVTTAIWRFKLFTTITWLRGRVSDPFRTLGNMMSGNFRGGKKEEQTPPKGSPKGQGVLSTILGGEAKELKRKEKTERSAKAVDDFKVVDALTLSLDNVLNVGKPNHERDMEDNAK